MNPLNRPTLHPFHQRCAALAVAVATVNIPLSSNQTPALNSGVAQTVTGCTP